MFFTGSNFTRKDGRCKNFLRPPPAPRDERGRRQMVQNEMNNPMNRRGFLQSSGLAVFALSGRSIRLTLGAAEALPSEDLGALLQPVLLTHALPGMAAAAVRGDRLVAIGVAGIRQVGRKDKITAEDRFLIGSCTKRMTGLMICRLIDAGRLSFETTLADSLPGVPMRDDYRSVTIAQLMSFTGGIQPYTQITPRLTPIFFRLEGSLPKQRDQFIKHLLQEAPVARPGTERHYSNASYCLLATVAASLMKQDWETVMEQEVFKPLGMASAGFGRPRSKDRPNQPAFHAKSADGYQPEPEERQAQPERILAGAGGVHCSIRDFAKFASYELLASQGKDPLLKPATAKCWQELSVSGRAEGREIFGGTQWMTAGYIIWPDENIAAAVAVNGGEATDACRAVFAVVKTLYSDLRK
jgi:CubicO group peptidase (beta-lactamase class C family)